MLRAPRGPGWGSREVTGEGAAGDVLSAHKEPEYVTGSALWGNEYPNVVLFWTIWCPRDPKPKKTQAEEPEPAMPKPAGEAGPSRVHQRSSRAEAWRADTPGVLPVHSPLGSEQRTGHGLEKPFRRQMGAGAQRSLEPLLNPSLGDPHAEGPPRIRGPTHWEAQRSAHSMGSIAKPEEHAWRGTWLGAGQASGSQRTLQGKGRQRSGNPGREEGSFFPEQDSLWGTEQKPVGSRAWDVPV